MVRIILVGSALMILSAFARHNQSDGDCLPCGPALLAGSGASASQDNDPMYVVGVYDPARDPASDLDSAITRATSENKRILIQVGGEWCIWCHILDDYIKNEKEVASELRENFLILKVNYDPANRNEAFLSKYPSIAGYPHIYVLEKGGSLLHSQHTDELEQGRSYSRSALLSFIHKWAPQQ